MHSTSKTTFWATTSATVPGSVMTAPVRRDGSSSQPPPTRGQQRASGHRHPPTGAPTVTQPRSHDSSGRGDAPLVLQRQLWGCLSAGSVVGGAGLGLASSPPPGPVGGVVEVGPRGADEGVEQASQFGHGQRDELAGSGGGAPFSAVARVADR